MEQKIRTVRFQMQINARDKSSKIQYRHYKKLECGCEASHGELNNRGSIILHGMIADHTPLRICEKCGVAQEAIGQYLCH